MRQYQRVRLAALKGKLQGRKFVYICIKLLLEPRRVVISCPSVYDAWVLENSTPPGG